MRPFLCALLILGAVASEAAICPKGVPPSGTLYVADTRGMTVQEQIFFSSIQGVTSQRKPRVYLLRQEAGQDEFWLDYLKEKGYITTIRRVNAWSLLKLFRTEIKGAVISDPELPASVNVATMLSGVAKLAVCTPELAERAGLEIKCDLRGKWKKNTEAYTWALDNLYPRMSRSALCSLEPYAGGGWLRDYLIQHRIFTFWIAGKDDKDRRGASDDERQVIGAALAKWPANIPVLGFWYAGEQAPGISEYGGLVLGGESGKYTIVSDWMSNASVHSGVRVPAEIFRQKHAPKLQLDRSKVYVMLTQFESGDAPWYWQRIQYKHWQDENRGKFPMNWCLGPATADLLPDILQWHYEHATPNDYFFCSMSGVGYMMPHAYATKVGDPEKVWREFMSQTADSMKRLHLCMVSLHTDAWHAKPQYEDSKVFRRYADGIPGLRAILADFGKLEELDMSRANHYSGGVPVFHTLNRWLVEGDPAEYLAGQIRESTPTTRPAFLSIMALSWTYSPTVIKSAVDKCGNEYVFVTAEQMVDLFKQSGSKLPPG